MNFSTHRPDRRTLVVGLAALSVGVAAAPPQSASPQRLSFTASDGTLLSYLKLGHGRPVVLLHGLLGNAQVNWFDTGVAQRIVAAGHQVIAPDFRGHGKSAMPTGASAYPPDVLARDQEELLRHLGVRRYDLGGYSLGSRMCVRMLARGARPGRVALGGMGDSGITDVDPGRLVFEDYVLNGAAARNPQFGAIVQSMMKKFGVSRDPILGVLRQQVSTQPAELRKLTTPILLVCGVDDHDNGSATGLLALLPSATLRQTPGTHLSALRTTEFMDAFTGFLSDAVG